MRLFKGSKLNFKELLVLDEPELRERFPAKTTIDNERYNELMLFLQRVHQQRSHPGFTLQYHYQEYRANASNPYSYTQFTTHYRAKYTREKSSMKLDHQAGVSKHRIKLEFWGAKPKIFQLRNIYNEF